MPNSELTELIEVRACPSRADAEEHALVLAAVGIDCRLLPRDDGVSLCVLAADVDRAKEQLSSYARENAPPKQGAPRGGLGLRGLDAALLYCALLLFFFVAARRNLFSVDWASDGAVQAGLIRDGAWWRTVTALVLHLDAGHLMGNLVFGTVFGVLLARLVGSGLAWLVVLLTGALGNALNVALQAPDHTAIGASTGIFGAVGFLSGYTQRARSVPGGSRLRRWAPVSAGIMLLAFIGFGGEHTDIWAHIWGFAVGGAMGFALAFARLERFMQMRATQLVSAGLAVSLLLLAWLLALYA